MYLTLAVSLSYRIHAAHPVKPNRNNNPSAQTASHKPSKAQPTHWYSPSHNALPRTPPETEPSTIPVKAAVAFYSLAMSLTDVHSQFLSLVFQSLLVLDAFHLSRRRTARARCELPISTGLHGNIPILAFRKKVVQLVICRRCRQHICGAFRSESGRQLPEMWNSVSRASFDGSVVSNLAVIFS